MAYSKIVITQGGVPAAAGVSRRDLDLYAVASQAVVFTNDTDGDIGVQSWAWTLVERPPGSAATLSGATSSSASLQADVYGRYVVSLSVNGLGVGTNGYSEIVAACSYATLGTAPGGYEIGEYAPPAFSEGTLANWSANPYGAQPEVYELFRQVRELVLPSLSGIDTAKQRIVFPQPPSLTSATDVAAPGWVVASRPWKLNMDDFPHVADVRFFAVFERTGTAGTAQVRLYDVTNAVAVTSSALTTSSATPNEYTSAALTVGSGAGNLRDDGDTLYSVEIEITGGVPATDYCTLFSCGLILSLV